MLDFALIAEFQSTSCQEPLSSVNIAPVNLNICQQPINLSLEDLGQTEEMDEMEEMDQMEEIIED